MRLAILPLLLATTACVSGVTEVPPVTSASAEAPYDLNAQMAKLAVVEMAPDTSYLTAEERKVVNLLIEASGYMSEIYKRQRLADYEQARFAVANNRRADRDLLLAMFDRNYGPWDQLAELHPFWGSDPMPEGAGFYPTDLTREEFDAYLAAHPDEAAALTSDYTIILCARRRARKR